MSNTRPPLMSKLRLLQKANRNLVIEVYIKAAVSVIFLFYKRHIFSYPCSLYQIRDKQLSERKKGAIGAAKKERKSRASVVM